ncbi:MAG: hypothetical protein LBK08_14195 [Treponema sp.]|nr:hypothetical protein [Treponema sp.]
MFTFPYRKTGGPEKTGYSAEWERTLAVLKRAQGAWKDNPWENYMEDLQAMRNEWDHRDFWNPDPVPCPCSLCYLSSVRYI